MNTLFMVRVQRGFWRWGLMVRNGRSRPAAAVVSSHESPTIAAPAKAAAAGKPVTPQRVKSGRFFVAFNQQSIVASPEM